MKRFLKVAIVGASEEAWKQIPDGIDKAKKKIEEIIDSYLFAIGTAKINIDRGAWEGTVKELVIISGHSPRGGIDIWTEEIAQKLGVRTEIYPPEVNQWNDKTVRVCNTCGELSDILDDTVIHDAIIQDPNHPHYWRLVTKRGYRSRNIQIAKECNILYDIEPANSCKYCKGRGYFYVEEDRPISFNRSKVFHKMIKCPKCEGDGAYSGGTWTLKYARNLGKEVHKIIIG